MHSTLCLLAMLAANAMPAAAQNRGMLPEQQLLKALQTAEQGGTVQAARLTRQTMAACLPADSSAYCTLGAILLCSGRISQADTAFGKALGIAPSDALALYGAGLTALAMNQPERAKLLFEQSARQGGDVTDITLATRYLQLLQGASLNLRQAHMPARAEALRQSLQAMSELHTGAQASVFLRLCKAESALKTPPFMQPFAPLATFSKSTPVAGGGVLQRTQTDVPPLPRTAPLQGIVQFAPHTSQGAAMVSFAVDGQTLLLSDVQPFVCHWNSRRASNGPHKLQITLYNSNGAELAQAVRTIMVYNPDAQNRADMQLRASLWRMLMLQPDRYALADTLGTLAAKQGDSMAARYWFIQAAAAHPNAGILRQIREYHLLSSGAPPVWGGPDHRKEVALTFDDGPVAGITDALLHTLQKLGVKGTFFVIGRHVLQHPNITKRIAAAGMELANHSFTHPNLTRLTPEEIARQILETDAAVLDATGRLPRYLRPPGGDWNPKVAAAAHQWGITPCMWSVDAWAAEEVGAYPAIRTVLQQVHPGAIILMHNGRLATIQALPTIVNALKKAGYRFVTVSRLLGMQPPRLVMNPQKLPANAGMR